MVLLADECFDDDILNGLVRVYPEADIERVQDVGLMGSADDEILAWAATQGRIVLSHDAKTLKDTFYRRLAGGEPVSGVILFPKSMDTGIAVELLHLICTCSEQTEWTGRVYQFASKP